MINQRILWFLDGLILTAHPRNHEEIKSRTLELMAMTGNRKFEHILVNPFACASMVQTALKRQDFTVVIDLTRSLSSFVVDNRIPELRGIHISRLRNVASNRMDGVGYLLSMPWQTMREKASRFNLSRPLIIDDVCWSGKSIEMIINNLGLSKEQTTTAFLVANNGHFGDNIAGGKRRLEKQGIRVVSGMDVSTPEDDGFHIEDFLVHGRKPLYVMFDSIIEIQRLRETPTRDSTLLVEQILARERNALFPSGFSLDKVREFANQGLIDAPNGTPKNGFLDTNPPNWLLPSWAKRASFAKMMENKNEIQDSLEGLHRLREQIEQNEVTREITHRGNERM